MNNKEVREIKRRLKPEKNNISQIFGCYINGATKEVISSFQEPVALLGQEEQKQYFALFNKCLSGSLGKTLTDISFSTQQVLEGQEHKLLTRLRNSRLEDEQARDILFSLLGESLSFEEKNYLILLAYDAYDIRYDKEEDNGGDVFRYVLCAVCPVTAGKPELGYEYEQKRFHHEVIGQKVGAPVLGFMFPAFDDRATNIYGALLYSKGAEANHNVFVEALFAQEAPMTAQEQKDCFDELVSQANDQRCPFEVAQHLNQELALRLNAHKESGSPELLTMSGEEIAELMEDSGSSPEQAEAFVQGCKERLGEQAEILPGNVCDPKRMTIETEQVKISLDPQYGHLVETRVENGRKYIVISAPGQVMMNGLPVEID